MPLPIDQKARRIKESDRMWQELEKMRTDETLQSIDPTLRRRLNRWFKRFQFHEDLHKNTNVQARDDYVKKLLQWKNRNEYQARKFLAALHACVELTNKLSDKTNPADPKNEHFQDFRNEALFVVHKKMLKLEIAQLRMLQKAQHIPRTLEKNTRLEDLNDHLTSARATLNNWAHHKKQNKTPPYSRLKHGELQKTSIFLSGRKKWIHFKPVFHRSRQTATVIDMGSALNALITRLVEICQAVAPLVQAIPFVSSIAAAIPVVITAIQAWVKKQSARKKIRSGFLIAILISSFTIIVLAAAGSGLMFIGLVAVFLTAVGFYVKRLDPWLKKRAKLAMKEKDYAAYQTLLSRNDLFNENEMPHHHDSLRILQACLLQKVEEAWIQEKINDKERDILVQKITQDSGTFVELQQDKTMKQVRGELSLRDLLIIDLSRYKKSYREEIAIMRTQIRRDLAYVITSITSLIGIILIIVPTPPTIFLGAALMVISAMVNVIITFEWDIKLKRAFGWKSKSAEKLTEPTQDKAHGPTPTANLQNRLNNQKQQKEQPTRRQRLTVISRKPGGSPSTPTPPEAGTPPPSPRKGKK